MKRSHEENLCVWLCHFASRRHVPKVDWARYSVSFARCIQPWYAETGLHSNNMIKEKRAHSLWIDFLARLFEAIEPY